MLADNVVCRKPCILEDLVSTSVVNCCGCFYSRLALILLLKSVLLYSERDQSSPTLLDHQVAGH